MEENVPTAPPRRRSEPRPTLLSEETTCQQFYRLHTEAFQCTVRGQQLDAEGSQEQAFNSYQKALQLIDKSVHLAHQGGFQTFPPDEVNKIDDMVYKMRMTRKEILERISDLQHSREPNGQLPSYLAGPSVSPSTVQSPAINDDPYRLPPAYNEAMAMAAQSNSPFGGLGTMYGSLTTALEEIASQQAAMANPLPVNAQEVFNIPNNVQIYFISSNENVSAPSYPSFLRVVVLQQDEAGDRTAPAFMQVGDWTYPLIPQRSPILRSAEGIYIFPDFSSNIPGSSVGLILPSELSEDHRQALEDVLLQLIGLTQFPEPSQLEHFTTDEESGRRGPLVKLPKESTPRFPEPPSAALPASETSPSFSTKIAAGLITGAEAISKGLAYGAVQTSHYLDKGTAYLQTKLEPAQQKPVITPQVKSGVKTAKNITGTAVQVSGYIVSQLGHATLALGHHLAPHVHKASTKLIARTTNSDEGEATRKVDQVLEVTSGAVVGFGTVYLGLEEAAKVLAKSISNNTVQIIHHRYGNEAGELAGDAAETAGNAALTAWNAKALGPKSVAKRAAKDTGKMVLKNYEEKNMKKGPDSGSGSGSSPTAGTSSQKN